MIMLGIIVVIVCALVVASPTLWSWLNEARSPDLDDDPPRTTRDTVECRHAVHEAGHAVAAWCCTHVGEVTLASIEAEDGAFIEYTTLKAQEPAVAWHMLVIHLAGVAAEAMVYTRSGDRTHATDDFKRAIERVHMIGSHPLPWTDPRGPSIDFRKIYVNPVPSDEHIRTLEAGYRMARHVVRRHRGDYYRLVSMLLTKRTASQADIARVLGRRILPQLLHPFGLVLEPKFVLPRRRGRMVARSRSLSASRGPSSASSPWSRGFTSLVA